MSSVAPIRPRDLTLLYVDEHLVAVDKPPRVLSVAGRGGEAPDLPTLMRQRAEFAANEPLRGVQRLDRDASGVLVYARTLAAQRQLTAAFERHEVEKVYIALVSGYVAADGEVDLPLAFDRGDSAVEVSPRRGKPALTRYHVLERVAGHTVLECRPLTGRLHQIRVHMAAIGHPLGVDPQYGGAERIMLSNFKAGYRQSTRHAERPLIERLTLHAARLSCRHPASGALLTIEAPLPKDLRVTIAQLGRALGGT